jgi:enamine deaminase RidA (YjgF/YER057c/UK114 family)
MEKKHINPDTLTKPRGFTQVVSVESPGRIVFISGQVAFNKEGKLVGAGDVGAQAKQCVENLKAALQAAGASPADIVKLNSYIVNYKSSDYAAFSAARNELAAGGNPPASTMVGVAALAVEGLLVEMEAIAIVK